jgi:hypothetical protein
MKRLGAIALFAALALLAACAGGGLHGPGGPGALRVAVIPLRNASNTPDAGAIVTDLIINELARSEVFEPIEPGQVRDVLISQRTLPQDVGPEVLSALREQLKADLVLIGVVESRQEEKGGAAAKAGFALTLISTRRGTVVWTGESQSAGDDHDFVLKLGRLHTADAVIRRGGASLVRQMEKTVISRKDLISQ